MKGGGVKLALLIKSLLLVKRCLRASNVYIRVPCRPSR